MATLQTQVKNLKKKIDDLRERQIKFEGFVGVFNRDTDRSTLGVITKQLEAAQAELNTLQKPKRISTPELFKQYASAKTDVERAEVKKKIDERQHLYFTENQGWADACANMYCIDKVLGGFFVRSVARDWRKQPYWGLDGKFSREPYLHEFEAVLKISELISFKERDRKLGHGDYDADFERVQMLGDLRVQVHEALTFAMSQLKDAA